MAARLTEKFVRSLPWAAGEALFNVLYGLSTVVVIGRFIAPGELGAASTAIAAAVLVEVLSSAGLHDAVVRSKSADTLVTDTAFVLAMGLAFLGMAVCALGAFLAAAAFDDRRLIALTIAASLTLPLNAAAVVPEAIFTRKMRAAALTRRMIGGKILGLTTLCLGGALGWGAWSLVLASLATSSGSLALLLAAMGRWPRMRLGFSEARGLMHFGAMAGAESILHTISVRAFSLLFGYFHGLAALGNFQLALRLAEEVGALINNAVIRFGLSFFAGKERAQADATDAFLKGTKLVTAATTPLFAGIALVANDFIPLVFGPQWEDSIPLLQITAVSWIVVFQRILIGLVLRARGQQTILVSFATVAASVALISCIATAKMPAVYGVIGFALRRFIIAPFVNIAIERYLQIPLKVQMSNVFGPMAAAAIMAIAVIAFQLALSGAARPVRLGGSIMTGVIAYSIALWVLSPETVKLARTLLARYTARG
jgi:O-antigen/teichoic acid export membrane protein